MAAEDVVQVVVAQDVAALRPVAADVVGARVAAFLDDVVDFVELDDVVVAARVQGHVRAVVDQVVGDPVADSRNADARFVGAEPAGRNDAHGCSRHCARPGTSVARSPPLMRNAATAGVIDVATVDLMSACRRTR